MFAWGFFQKLEGTENILLHGPVSVRNAFLRTVFSICFCYPFIFLCFFFFRETSGPSGGVQWINTMLTILWMLCLLRTIIVSLCFPPLYGNLIAPFWVGKVSELRNVRLRRLSLITTRSLGCETNRHRNLEKKLYMIIS